MKERTTATKNIDAPPPITVKVDTPEIQCQRSESIISGFISGGFAHEMEGIRPGNFPANRLAKSDQQMIIDTKMNLGWKLRLLNSTMN